MIGTPCYDGRVDIWYTHSLCETLKLALDAGIQIIPVWVSFDALIQRARNDTLHLAHKMQVDDLIWIDSDIEWKPEWFFKLLDYPVDVVGGTYRKKGDREEYVVRRTNQESPDPSTGLLRVEGLGTGFVRMSKTAIDYLWDTSESYIDPKDNEERKLICNVVIENGDLVSEDIWMFKRLDRGGFNIWLDPNMTCNHIGSYKFQGDFRPWFKLVNESRPAPIPAIKPIKRQL